MADLSNEIKEVIAILRCSDFDDPAYAPISEYQIERAARLIEALAEKSKRWEDLWRDAVRVQKLWYERACSLDPSIPRAE